LSSARLWGCRRCACLPTSDRRECTLRRCCPGRVLGAVVRWLRVAWVVSAWLGGAVGGCARRHGLFVWDVSFWCGLFAARTSGVVVLVWWRLFVCAYCCGRSFGGAAPRGFVARAAALWDLVDRPRWVCCVVLHKPACCLVGAGPWCKRCVLSFRGCSCRWAECRLGPPLVPRVGIRVLWSAV